MIKLVVVAEILQEALRASWNFSSADWLYHPMSVKTQISIFKSHTHIFMCLQDMISQVPGPCVLVDMGSGNAIKTRFFIDAFLEQQRSLQYIPVDISEGYLHGFEEEKKKQQILLFIPRSTLTTFIVKQVYTSQHFLAHLSRRLTR